MNLDRKFRDRDYLQTEEDFLFCVLGSVHPEDRVFAYLKYVPDPTGKWGVKGRKYRRALPFYTMKDLLETFKFLERWPDYLFYSVEWNVKISAVPITKIKYHFKPENKVKQLISQESLDRLQRKAVDLIKVISERSGVSVNYFGLTGSILLGIHRDFSDIDVIVYGKYNKEAVKKALISLYNEETYITRLNEQRAKEWCQNKVELYPLTYREAEMILKRRWNKGIFKGTMFSIHPVKIENEVLERYGQRIFKPKGLTKIKATVLDNSESEFLPATYIVENVKVVNGPRVNDIREVTSYEGLYGGIAEVGEKILCFGKLEEVSDLNDGFKYHRLLVGSREAEGKDYIKPLGT